MNETLPLYTYKAIEFIEKHITDSMSVFEYGTGVSTFWWANRVRRVVACDHSKRWYENILLNEPANVEPIHVELIYGGDYCRTVAQYPGEFDIIVVDGRDRINCVNYLSVGLNKSGVIIWDNSDEVIYRPGLEQLASLGFNRTNFMGTGPVPNYTGPLAAPNPDSVWETCIFHKDGNCMQL